ncbi:MAG: (d)CMP kinase [Candidatus Dormibacter sp.]
MSSRRIVTVDGPAGSGKSTLGRALATELALPLIDTGLFYRGLMVAAVRAGLDDTDPAALEMLARTTSLVIDTDPGSDGATVLVDGVAAGAQLHDPGKAALLAAIASEPMVRAAVLELQRRPARDGAVAVGRDCGTVVFPQAAVKFYLDAPQALREQRRTAQLRKRGADADGRAIRAEIGARDRSDSQRSASPLRRADDAHVIDTSTMGRDEMIAYALTVCGSAGLQPGRSR